MKILLINNDGGGFADYIDVAEGTTLATLFLQRVPHGKPQDYLIRVNRQPVTTAAQVNAAVDSARRAGRTSILLLVKRGSGPEAFFGIDISGRIASIGQVLDPATRRVQIRCVVANEEQLLKPEMFARVAPLSEERQKLARIPNSALVSEGLYSFVFVETAAGVFERRRVTLGLQGRDESYVRTGLSAGEKVVAAGALLLQSELASRR